MAHDSRQSGLWNRNPDTGFFEQTPIPTAQIRPKGPYQYYEPPPRGYEVPRRSFSERAGNTNLDATVPTDNISRTVPSKRHGVERVKEADPRSSQPVAQSLDRHPDRASEKVARAKSIKNNTTLGPVEQAPLRINQDFVPSDFRNTSWSPDAFSSDTQSRPDQRYRQTSLQTSEISETLRRDSVPDRSPLQSLESWSKEEKRARLEEAERNTRKRSLAGAGRGQGEILRSGTLRGKGRIASEDLTESDQNAHGDSRRHVSNPISPTDYNSARGFDDTARREDMRGDKVSPTSRSNRSRSEKAQPLQRSALPNDSIQRSSLASAPRQSSDLGRSRSAKDSSTGREPSRSDYNEAAERGRVAYERRKASMPYNAADPALSPSLQTGGQVLGIGRSASEKLQVRTARTGDHSGNPDFLNDRIGTLDSPFDPKTPSSFQQPNSVSQQHVPNGPTYLADPVVPPQTTTVRQGRENVSWDTQQLQDSTQDRNRDAMYPSYDQEYRTYQPSATPLEEWRSAKALRLTVQDLELEQVASNIPRNDSKNDAWWEKSERRASLSRPKPVKTAQLEGPYEEQAIGFQPRLFLKCGPLLRYTGIRKESHPGSPGNDGAASETEVWRGSVMIVTDDEQSDIRSAPVLRMFVQPMDLHELAPHNMQAGKHELRSEHEDPIAGQVKLSRTGRALYVRPIHNIDGDIDLSREENNRGLYAATRTPALGPLSNTASEGPLGQHVKFENKSRIKKRDGEKLGRFREVKATRLHTERGYTFWRFNVEIELGGSQHRIAYRINSGPAIAFWVPAKGETMNVMFHSCNGFSPSVDSNSFSGPDPLWRNVLNRHQVRPFHVMIGGGSQIYNDAASRDTRLFKEWLQTKDLEQKHNAEFSSALQDELERYYLDRYAMWFSQGLFSMANSQIPMVNLWDDHDIIGGYGSFSDHFMSTRVFTGLGAVAFKYYLLFQHSSLVTETEKEEPSWLLGKSPGPYIGELSRNIFLSLGHKVAFLGLDSRTERTRGEVLSQSTYDEVFDRCRSEIVRGQTKHLVVLLGVPIAYPRLNFLENILNSRVMDPIKAIGRTGAFGGLVSKFDGGVELLDDLDDHWTAKRHKAERNWFVEELQEISAEKSVRVTILGGHVQLGVVGRFYSNTRSSIPKDRDYRYMANVVSSAIVNAASPIWMADVLNRRRKIHHLDADTDEDMIPMFSHDVDGTRRNNAHLLARRTFCTINEYFPGSTRPNSPVQERVEPGTSENVTFGNEIIEEKRDRRFPPSSMKRSVSLTRGPANLVRRLSGSSRNKNPPLSLPQNRMRSNSTATDGQAPTDVPWVRRTNSLGGPRPDFPPHDSDIRPTFHRRPTDLSIKEAKKAARAAEIGGNVDGRAPGHIDLEGGLDISLCAEIDQHNPSGDTTPYRLLVPALWYDDSDNRNLEKFTSHRGSLIRRLKWNRNREAHVGEQDAHHAWSGSDISRTPSPDSATRQNTELNSASHGLSLTATGRDPYQGSKRVSIDMSPTVAGKQAVSNDASPRSVPTATAPQTNWNLANVYNQGLNLSSPPIGSATESTRRPYAQARYDNAPYPQSGYRRSDQVAAQQQQERQPPVDSARGWARSLTPSDEYDENEEDYRAANARARRGSKVEQFFGLTKGRIGNGRSSMQHDRPEYDGEAKIGTDGPGSVKRKAGWNIWK